MKKYLLTALFVAFLVGSSPVLAEQQPSVEALMKQVQMLLETVKSLQAQLSVLQSGGTPTAGGGTVTSGTGIATPVSGSSSGETPTPGNVTVASGIDTSIPSISEDSCTRLLSTSKIGSSGEDVSALQTLLIEKGYDIPAISSGATKKGYYGNQTKDAVIKYQKTESLPMTGVIDTSTLQKVKAVSIASIKCPPSRPPVEPPVEYPKPKPPIQIDQSITVVSPNGGETWAKNTVQTIKWQDNSITPPCPVGLYCAQNVSQLKTYDLKLAEYHTPCAGPYCPAYAYREPYTIAKGVAGSSYNWTVGNIIDTYSYGTSQFAPEGQYTIQVCQFGTGAPCDSSDSYFKIISGSSTNQPPVVSGVTAPTTLAVNQTGTWTVNASDPENGPLSYSVSWGDLTTTPNSSNIPSSSSNSFVQTSTFTHSYSTAGTYTVYFTVKDNAGLTVQTSTTVRVGDIVQPSITVLSPNGGESWAKNTVQTIKWQDNRPVPQCGSTETGLQKCVSPAPMPYDILLIGGYCPPNAICTNYTPSYTIAKNVNGNSYSWEVGTIVYGGDAIEIVPDNSYTIRICQTGTNTCDSSDSYFKIYSGSSNNQPPVISGLTAPTTLQVNQTGTWTVNASDPENGPLSYSVSWGDLTTTPNSSNIPSSSSNSFVQTSTFTHSYSTAGTYTVYLLSKIMLV